MGPRHREAVILREEEGPHPERGSLANKEATPIQGGWRPERGARRKEWEKEGQRL